VTPVYTEGANLLEVVQRHSGALARLARRLVGSPEDAEEIVQEALLRTYTHRLQRAQKPREIRATVYKITHNLSVDHLRRRRLRLMDREAMDRRPNPRSLTPDEAAYVEALRAAVRQAVEDLPQNYRDVIAMRFGMGLTHRAIARALGVGVSAVESRLHRAKARLRHQLRPWAVNPAKRAPTAHAKPPARNRHARRNSA
jgi:RNA polymerase sigma-70 factor (ECF subfamily)